ncbi:MAG: peptidase M14 [Rhizobacter sp.]|nr:peptidase M14 [Rhizobacter sp.]
MTDTPLLDLTLPRTLDQWVARFSTAEWRGATVEGWLFEDAPARRAAEARLRRAGVHATLRSAYKPLVHFFLEEVDCARITSAVITYPVHGAATARRFLLEAYPLAAMLPACEPVFVAGNDTLDYHVALTFDDGTQEHVFVAAPNRVHTDFIGSTLLSPTGWLRASAQVYGVPHLNAAESTDYEQLFDQVVQLATGHAWPAQESYFERLDIRVDLPGGEQALPLPGEVISRHEALHEDLYFSLMEIFQRRSGRAEGDRRLQPGQIVPDIRFTGGAPRLRVTLSRFDRAAQDAHAVDPQAPPLQALATLAHPPHPEQIAATLTALGGDTFGATTRQGRAVWGLNLGGSGAPVLVSSGQHANETSGIVGTLRAAEQLKAAGSAFALVALENPDGYALHRELRAQHPLHIHHAARYSALGDDIEYRDGTALYEREARERALALSGAQLHINLHGYPAHEWTRPLTGYVPRGFGLWTIPKGFFLILRHQPGWATECRALLEAVCEALLDVSGLPGYNARQMALYRQHAGELPFDILHGTAYTQTETTPARPGAPVTLITEFPDETVAGDDFRFAHTVQMRTVLAATAAWQRIARA